MRNKDIFVLNMGNCCGAHQTVDRPGLDVKVPVPQKVIANQVPNGPAPPKIPQIGLPPLTTIP